MRCVLVGNFGVGNWGDEMLQIYFQTRFPEVEWTVVTQTPVRSTDVPRLPLRLHLLFHPWGRTLKAFYTCDAVVFGGGTLFTDSERLRAVWMWWAYASLASLCRKPLVFAFQGVGPLRTRLGMYLARSMLRRAAFLSVRDVLSEERVRKMDVPVPIHASFDPVLLLLGDGVSLPSRDDSFGIIPRKNSPDGFVEEAVQAARSSSAARCAVILFEPDAPRERRIAKRLLEHIPGAVLCEIRTFEDAVREIGRCTAVLSMRFHGSLMAHGLGVRVIARPLVAMDKHEVLDRMMKDRSINLLAERAKLGEDALRDWLARYGATRV